MSDLKNTVAMLTRAKVGYEVYDTRTPRSPDDVNEAAEDLVRSYRPQGVVVILMISWGYRCHCEMMFTADENLVDVGAFVEM